MNPEEACRRKRQYQSRRQAREWARRIRRRCGKHLRPYPCPYCQGYHLATVHPHEEHHRK